MDMVECNQIYISIDLLSMHHRHYVTKGGFKYPPYHQHFQMNFSTEEKFEKNMKDPICR